MKASGYDETDIQETVEIHFMVNHNETLRTIQKMSDEVKDYETGILMAKIMSMRTYDDKG